MTGGDIDNQQGMLDAGAVRTLMVMLGNDPEGLAELVDAFLEEAPQRLSELAEGATACDHVLVGRAAHTLKANAEMFGAAQLEGLCRSVEAAARGGDLEGAPSLIAAAGAEWLVVRPQLLALRERGTAP